ncbi:mitochondrial carrier domain-containing protein [Globomyces pollinis-pini]|nr:mitochondrial carrier domain-containing protein [Globomyces pollinis-pini]
MTEGNRVLEDSTIQKIPKLKEPQKSPFLHLAAGSVSGLLSCVLLQPLDLRLQQSIHNHNSLKLNYNHNHNLLSTLLSVVRNDSVWTLWRGTTATILRNVPGSGLYFYSLHLLRSNLHRIQYRGNQVFSQNFIHLSGGVVARVAVGFIMMPITVVKIRFESSLYQYTNITNAFRSIIKTDGFRGLFAGFGATALRDAPFAGIYVFFYENFKAPIATFTTSHSLTNISSGLLAGLAATISTQPFDMIKTRIQLQPTEYPNLVHSFRRVFAEEGYRGFFGGMVPRMLRKTMSSAISWTIYEEVVRYYK